MASRWALACIMYTTLATAALLILSYREKLKNSSLTDDSIEIGLLNGEVDTGDTGGCDSKSKQLK